jgi:hypothetical protein
VITVKFRPATVTALLALLAAGALVPALPRAWEVMWIHARVDRLASAPAQACGWAAGALARPVAGAPLASWQTVGGCGATGGTGVGAGVKWIGRNVTGGLFGVQCQGVYTPLRSDPRDIEEQYMVTTLVSREITDSFSAGVLIPYAYKYMHNPYRMDPAVDLGNGGLSDVSVQGTLRLGTIRATAITAALTLPTGMYDTEYKRAILRQHQQLGFGKVAGALTVDHTFDQIWGLAVLGGVASWRGGENSRSNYRAPSGSGYGYVGYFLGPLVPAAGLSVTGLPAHDRDQGQDEYTALFSTSVNLSLEWSNSWLAILVGYSLPYQYDGFDKDDNGLPRSPWGFGPWTLSVGASFAPF